MTYTCTSFQGHWPVGTAAVVVADTAMEAAALLNAELRELGLPGDVTLSDMEPLSLMPHVKILCDGNY